AGDAARRLRQRTHLRGAGAGRRELRLDPRRERAPAARRRGAREGAMRVALFALGAALMAGCTAIPRATNELESARAAYRTAAASPEVQARAPVELQIAERA